MSNSNILFYSKKCEYSSKIINLISEIDSIDKYKFWRIYSGFKIKKNFSLKSNPSYGSDTEIKDFNDWTSSIYINAGYNTWNISLEYDLNPIIEDKKTINGDNLNISFLRLGLIFYFL